MGEQMVAAGIPGAPVRSEVQQPALSVLDVFEAAAHDVTGALTRGTWFARAERDLSVAAAVGRPSVLLADVDHFKRCNDTYGHAAGDQVLASVVWAIRTQLRHVDLVGRFGGDELAVLLAGDLTVNAVTRIADRIRARVERLTVNLPGGQTSPDVAAGRCEVGGLTVSIGVALPEAGTCPPLKVLLAAADTALYAAKDSGRNAVRTVEIDASETFAPVEPRHAR